MRIAAVFVLLIACAPKEKPHRDFLYNPDTFTQSQLDQLLESVAIFNEAVGCSNTPVLNLRATDQTDFKSRNNKSEIYIVPEMADHVGAVTSVMYNVSQYDPEEVDIKVSDIEPLLFIKDGVLTEIYYDYHSLYLHEFGHAFGLEHSDNELDIMYRITIVNWSDLDVLERFTGQLRDIGVGCVL